MAAGGDQSVPGGGHLALEVPRMSAQNGHFSSRGESRLSWPGLPATLLCLGVI